MNLPSDVEINSPVSYTFLELLLQIYRFFGCQTKQVEHYSAMFLLFTSTQTTWEEWFMPTLSQFLKRSDVL